MPTPQTIAIRVRYEWLRYGWRRRGAATLKLAGHPFTFVGVGERPHDWFAHEVYRKRWETAVLECYARSIRPGDVVLDIGAYLGPYALLGGLLTGPSGRVFTFEPDPVARRLLERNLQVNGAGNVEVVELAVSDGPGSLRLTGELGRSETQVSQDGSGAEVQTIGLDEFCRTRGLVPAVVKMDVEGGEERIIGPAAERTLSEARAVFVEIHPRAGANVERIDRVFADMGKRRVLLDERWGDQYNVVYLA